MPLPTKVNEVTSNPVPVSPKDYNGDHSTFSARGSKPCPTSNHPRKEHRAQAHARQTVTITWSDGRTSRSYIDHCKCRFCGHEWQQEWMNA
jgi:hypothetical protein